MYILKNSGLNRDLSEKWNHRKISCIIVDSNISSQRTSLSALMRATRLNDLRKIVEFLLSQPRFQKPLIVNRIKQIRFFRSRPREILSLHN